MILSQSVLVVAVTVDGEGRREVLGVDLVNREAGRAGAIFCAG